MTPAETPSDRRHRIRNVAREFRLRHSPACRTANNVGAPRGEGRFPFHCECSFFADVKAAEAGLLLVCRKAVCGIHARRASTTETPAGWVVSPMFKEEWYCSAACLNEIEPLRGEAPCRHERMGLLSDARVCEDCGHTEKRS